MTGESVEKVLVESNQIVIGFYGIIRITDGRFKCIGFIYQDLE